jgi:plasmid replication initiation protein
MNDTCLKPVKLKVSEFIDLRNVGQNQIERLRDALRKLSRLNIRYSDENNVPHERAVFSAAEWRPRSGSICLTFNAAMKPELIKLRGKFTQYNLAMYRRLKGKYAKDLYEKLSVWLRNNGQRKYRLDELYDLLSVPPYARNSFKEFNKNILGPAVAKINKETDWTLEYKTEKKRLFDKKADNYRLRTANIIFIRKR